MTAETKTCGDCEHLKDAQEPQPYGYCHHPFTVWHRQAFPLVHLQYKDAPADLCPCFKRKAKP